MWCGTPNKKKKNSENHALIGSKSGKSDRLERYIRISYPDVHSINYKKKNIFFLFVYFENVFIDLWHVFYCDSFNWHIFESISCILRLRQLVISKSSQELRCSQRQQNNKWYFRRNQHSHRWCCVCVRWQIAWKIKIFNIEFPLMVIGVKKKYSVTFSGYHTLKSIFNLNFRLFGPHRWIHFKLIAQKSIMPS